ncbi:MAG: DUF192 domain-containing protein [Chlamydiota bacterium]
MRRELRCVPLLCALPLIALSCGDEPPRLKLDTGVLRVGGREIMAEIARTPSEMSRGLMYRRSLGKECGMLFAYETPRNLSFWMKNTRIPLDIAFLDDGGRILQVEEMQPYDELGRTVSREPARYALEMNRGWFAANGVTVGDVVQIP